MNEINGSKCGKILFLYHTPHEEATMSLERSVFFVLGHGAPREQGAGRAGVPVRSPDVR